MACCLPQYLLAIALRHSFEVLKIVYICRFQVEYLTTKSFLIFSPATNIQENVSRLRKNTWVDASCVPLNGYCNIKTFRLCNTFWGVQMRVLLSLRNIYIFSSITLLHATLCNRKKLSIWYNYIIYVSYIFTVTNTCWASYNQCFQCEHIFYSMSFYGTQFVEQNTHSAKNTRHGSPVCSIFFLLQLNHSAKSTHLRFTT